METIEVIGELDLYKAPEIKRIIYAQIEQGVYEIGLDLKECNFVDSSGISMLVMVAQKLKQCNGKLTVLNKPSSLKQILDLTTIWDIDG